MKGGVFRAHPAVASRAVLEVVSVTVLHEPFPFAGHLGRCLYEIVLGPKVVGVIGLVDLPDIVQKPFERLSISVLVDERRERLVHLVESLHAGEDVVGPLQPPAHEVGHLHFLKRGIESPGVSFDKLLRLRLCQYADA